tara:strand:- start:371 stop:697 length:327 start_codon:yes stop_codon:yes gene_type:complete
MKKINLLFILVSIFLTSCQSIKDGLSGKKNENSDEFLVQKKNPLVLPPNFMDLPSPEDELYEDELSKIEEETQIENILNIGDGLQNKKVKRNDDSSAEDFVLDQIKKK